MPRTGRAEAGRIRATTNDYLKPPVNWRLSPAAGLPPPGFNFNAGPTPGFIAPDKHFFPAGASEFSQKCESPFGNFSIFSPKLQGEICRGQIG